MQLPQGIGKLVLVGAAALVGLLVLVKASSLASLIGAFSLLLAAVWYAEQGGIVTFLSVRDRAVLVTGCDSGFGFELAHQLDAQGLHVFAGCLFKDGEGAKKLRENCSERLHVVQLDVRNEKQIENALEFVKKNLPKHGLWAIVNNAGLNFIGETELTTMEQFERVIDINLLGAIRITKAFMPLIIKKKGRIVNVTSVKGLMTPEFNGAYAASKYGLEGFSDSLRLEMRKWGVKVVIIEPCTFGSATKCVDKDRLDKDFATMWDNMDQEARDRYGKEYVDHFNTLIEGSDRTSCYNINPVISAMSDAILNPKPKIRYLIGGGSGWYDEFKFYCILGRYLPTSVMDYLIYRWSGAKFAVPKALQN